MQTFLVDADFAKSALFIDSRRLQKQLLEGRQILTALAGKSKGWRRHPATLMWEGSETVLVDYLDCVAAECVELGIAVEKNVSAIERLDKHFRRNAMRSVLPRWYRTPSLLDRVLFTHRASLYRKDPEYYATFNPEAQMVDDDWSNMVCCLPTVGPRGGKKKGCTTYWPSHKENV